MQMKKFRADRASLADAKWLGDILNREGKKLGTRVEINEDNNLVLRWQ